MEVHMLYYYKNFNYEVFLSEFVCQKRDENNKKYDRILIDISNWC